jgi:hypothetical protein
MVAQNIAKGVGPKVLGKLGAGGKLLGRASGLVGVGFMALELFRSYKNNIEQEPAYQEMVILQHELEMWGSAISCLGRKRFAQSRFGDLHEGGAINALTEKQTVSGGTTQPADPEAAAALIDRSIGYIRQTENVFEDDAFDEKRDDLVDRLAQLRTDIAAGRDHGAIGSALAEIVDVLKPIESACSSRIYDCSQEIQKKIGSNAAWATLSMVTLGIVKKPSADHPEDK